MRTSVVHHACDSFVIRGVSRLIAFAKKTLTDPIRRSLCFIDRQSANFWVATGSAGHVKQVELRQFLTWIFPAFTTFFVSAFAFRESVIVSAFETNETNN